MDMSIAMGLGGCPVKWTVPEMVAAVVGSTVGAAGADVSVVLGAGVFLQPERVMVAMRRAMGRRLDMVIL
jgi:hypothetical protein